MREAAGFFVALTLLLGSGCAPSPPSSILLVTIACMGPEAIDDDALPALAALGRDGLSFGFAFAPSPYTTASHASLFTGRPPSFHGAGVNGRGSLTDADTTIAERLRRAGYRTAAFLAHPALGRETGLDRGFDDFVDRPVGRTASVVAAEALASARDHAAGPRFVWVHLADAHPPHTCPHPNHDLRSAYRCELGLVDDAIAALRDGFALGEWLWIVTGDHGLRIAEMESVFGESVAEDQVRVPLWILGPHVEPGGRIDAPVGTAVEVSRILRDEGLGIRDLREWGLEFGYTESVNQVGVFGHNAYLRQDREPPANEPFWDAGNPITGRPWRPSGRELVYPLDADRPPRAASLPALNGALTAFVKAAAAARVDARAPSIQWSAERRRQLEAWGYRVE